jgi:hypothetical protein
MRRACGHCSRESAVANSGIWLSSRAHGGELPVDRVLFGVGAERGAAVAVHEGERDAEVPLQAARSSTAHCWASKSSSGALRGQGERVRAAVEALGGRTGQRHVDTGPASGRASTTTDLGTHCPEATERRPQTWRLGSPRTPRPGALSRADRVNVAALLGHPQAERSEAAEHVGKAVVADTSSGVVVLGDLNATTDDGEPAPSPPGFIRPGPPPAPASASPTRRLSRWSASTRSSSAAWTRTAPGPSRPTAATTSRPRRGSAGELPEPGALQYRGPARGARGARRGAERGVSSIRRRTR